MIIAGRATKRTRSAPRGVPFSDTDAARSVLGEIGIIRP